tara:strand:- start:367 stop:1053 length:687 start_codon:yes stop_codon:yes gene_type:complete
MPVKIHGKDYTEVAERITSFIDKYGDEFSLQTEIKNDTETHIDVVCSIQVGDAVRTGMAREYYELKNSKAVNFAHALENAETSAVGRALTWWGFGGDHVASAEDMENIAAKTNARQSQLKGDDKPVEKPSTKSSNNGQQVSPEVKGEWNKIVREAKNTWAGMAVGAKDKDGNDVADRPAWKQEVQGKFVELYCESKGFQFFANSWKDLSRAELDLAYKELFPNLVETD